jgi:hypothetical protein
MAGLWYGWFAGVHATEHYSNINSMCNDLYGIIVTLCHGFPGMMLYTYAYVTCVAAIDLCDLLWYNSDAYLG